MYVCIYVMSVGGGKVFCHSYSSLEEFLLCFRDWFGEGGLWKSAGFLDAATENEGLCS